MKRSIKLYLKDITIAIKRIEEYIKELTYEGFLEDSMVQDAVVRNLEIIGEAARNIPKEVKVKYVFIPWKEIIGMRNKVIHEYFGVDIEILWQTLKEDIPDLKKKIVKLEME